MEYFHVSNAELPVGFLLTPCYGKKVTSPDFYRYDQTSHAQYLREMIIEEIRASNYPEKPSRLNTVFLFDDIRQALQYQREQDCKYLYGVEIEEGVSFHKGDMKLIDLTVCRSIQEIRTYASSYYSAESSIEPLYEIIWEGEARVLEQIKKF